MKKYTGYFSHDSNARSDEKILNVRMKYGAEGYGIYFMILEIMREASNYMCLKDYNAIAFELRVDASKVKSVVEDFGLFVFTDDGKYFYSESFLGRMKLKDDSKQRYAEAGKKGAKARWGDKKDGDAIAMPSEKNSDAMAMPRKKIASKVKESKESKENNNPPISPLGEGNDNIPPVEKPAKEKPPDIHERRFMEFMKLYPKPVGYDYALQCWRKKVKTAEIFEDIKTALAWQVKSEQWTKDNGQYVPNPSTYINQGRWKDKPPKIVKLSAEGREVKEGRYDHIKF